MLPHKDRIRAKACGCTPVSSCMERVCAFARLSIDFLLQNVNSSKKLGSRQEKKGAGGKVVVMQKRGDGVSGPSN